ncbi:MAG: hypothetical protein HYU33_06770 [Candidatus Omnitrophica bacterium]|nr:hypothetical protein [Candidatus Omnitrophota bacterium]MBI3009514.1 hypothetical protein [Candidatus Omnitrophota bacterium]
MPSGQIQGTTTPAYWNPVRQGGVTQKMAACHRNLHRFSNGLGGLASPPFVARRLRTAGACTLRSSRLGRLAIAPSAAMRSLC